MKKNILNLLIALFCSMLLTPSFANEGPNLIQNSYFDGNLAHWNFWGNEPSAQFDRINGFYALITGRAALNQVVIVKPNTTYKLSVNMFLKPGSKLNIGAKDAVTEENEQYLSVYNQNEWVRKAELTIKSNESGQLKVYLFIPNENDQAHITYVNFREITEPSNARFIATVPESEIPTFVNEFTAYPNPFTDVLNVNFSGNYEIAQIVDFSGKVISEQNVIGRNEIRFSPKLDAGIYLLRLSSKTGTKILQVIKK